MKEEAAILEDQEEELEVRETAVLHPMREHLLALHTLATQAKLALPEATMGVHLTLLQDIGVTITTTTEGTEKDMCLLTMSIQTEVIIDQMPHLLLQIEGAITKGEGADQGALMDLATITFRIDILVIDTVAEAGGTTMKPQGNSLFNLCRYPHHYRRNRLSRSRSSSYDGRRYAGRRGDLPRD